MSDAAEPVKRPRKRKKKGSALNDDPYAQMHTPDRPWLELQMAATFLAFRQIEAETDRAAGIVAGSILEGRLEAAIASRWIEDAERRKTIFKPEGVLGTFGGKIALAYMMGLITDQARAELKVISDIRNDFAHKIEVDSFQINSVRDRCFNLKMVEDYLVSEGRIRPVRRDRATTKWHGFNSETERQTALSSPRERYVFSVRMLMDSLADAAFNPARPVLPYV